MSQCQQLAAEASAGVAPALRAVDCLASESGAAAFGRLFGGSGALAPALTVLLTLYIAGFALALLTGRSRLSLSALTPRMLTLGLVLTFATSWIAYQSVLWNLAVGAPDQIAGIITGSSGSATRMFADRIDLVFAALAEVAADNGPAATVPPPGAFNATTVVWLGALLLLLGTVGVLVTARIALAVLLAVGPVFVVLALFTGTRGLTAGWLRGLVLAAVTPLYVVVGGGIVMELLVPVVAALRNGEGGIDARAAMALVLVAFVHVALMLLIGRVTATTVAAWSVFGLSHRTATPRADTPSPTSLTASADPRLAPAQLPSPSRSGAALAAASAPTVTPDTAPSPASRTLVLPGVAGAASAWAPHAQRARGIGSRFRSLPQTSLARGLSR